MRILVAMVALAVAAPALAGPTGGVEDPYGATAIAKGHIVKVERRLAAAYQNGGRETELLLNLAAIRRQQRDDARAHELYRMVLAQPNADMATLTGTAWSHDIARRGLASGIVAANW